MWFVSLGIHCRSCTPPPLQIPPHTRFDHRSVRSASTLRLLGAKTAPETTAPILISCLARTNQLRSDPISVQTNPMRFHVASWLQPLHRQSGISGTGLVGLSLARSHGIGLGPKDVTEATVLHTSRTRFRPAA